MKLLDRAVTGVVAAAGVATAAVVVRDARRRARAPKPRVLTWAEAVEKYALKCGVCGCDDDHACVTAQGACSWAIEPAPDFPGLCSACLLCGLVQVDDDPACPPQSGPIDPDCCKACRQAITRVPRIDADIIEHVHEMRPESLAQRVALEQSLQTRRDEGGW